MSAGLFMQFLLVTILAVIETLCVSPSSWSIRKETRTYRRSPFHETWRKWQTALRLCCSVQQKYALLIRTFWQTKKDSETRWQRFFSALTHKLRGFTIELHTEDRDDTPSWTEFRKECKDKLPSIIPEGLTLTVYRWKKRDGGERLHNRYILTDIGGVFFGIGLDEGNLGETDDVVRFRADSYRQRWNDYDERNGTFDLDGKVSLEGRATS